MEPEQTEVPRPAPSYHLTSNAALAGALYRRARGGRGRFSAFLPPGLLRRLFGCLCPLGVLGAEDALDAPNELLESAVAGVGARPGEKKHLLSCQRLRCGAVVDPVLLVLVQCQGTGNYRH